MRVLVDYRPALRERTGVGEYLHNLLRAYAHAPLATGTQIALFTSSWADRPSATSTTEITPWVVDRRIPVRVLNYVWHRLEWPSAETIAGSFDLVHAAHPLLIPARHAGQVITVHDLFFMDQPHTMQAEIRRDYPALAPDHARRADAIVTPSHYTASLVTRTFGVSPDRLHVCSPGAPSWQSLGRQPNVPEDGYVLFVGTLAHRKNLGVLLDAYALLIQRGETLAPLLLAGQATRDSATWLERLTSAPLAGHVRHLGYVPVAGREELYAGARLLVLPSLDEGFGIPVLEAMSAGVPVIASTCGSLPEVLGDAGLLVDPHDVEGLAAALLRMLHDRKFALMCAQRGLARAATFSWERAAISLHGAYQQALTRRRER